MKREDNTFFLVKTHADIEAVREYISARPFNGIEWAIDKKGNPMCRIDDTGKARRVATVVCRNHKMKMFVEEVIAEITKARAA